MTVQNAIIAATRDLSALGISGAQRDARLLMAAALGIDVGRLTLHLHDELSQTVYDQFDAMIRARSTHRPISRILGQRLFWGRLFSITDDVLDPRGDTETIIEHVLKRPATTVLDLGTGSGILAITLAAEWGNAHCVASDISNPALDVARQNARDLGVSERVQFLQSNWFENISGTFDLIVSNPPYISDLEMTSLSPDVLHYDPKIALTPGGDGLDPYRMIARDAARHLNPNGRIAVEIGYKQGRDVSMLFSQAGFQNVYILRDLEGQDRVVVADAAK